MVPKRFLQTLTLAALSVNVLNAQEQGSYTTPDTFMALFFDFTGSHEPDYPGTQPTIGQMMAQSEIAKAAAAGESGPLILIMGSDIYLYDSANQQRLGHIRFRADRSNGFYELTAISHIGPAIAYLARIHESGSNAWKPRINSLLQHVRAVRTLNASTQQHWLDQLNQPAWSTHNAAIRDMVDYACARTEDYINSIGDGQNFTASHVNDEFFNGISEEFPVPFNNVMVGTFMLEALRGGYNAKVEFGNLGVNWAGAMALVSSQAGTNVSSGLTQSTNWLVFFLRALSGFELPDDRIIIAPYANRTESLGQDPMPIGDFEYYTQKVWGQLYYRRLIADRVFKEVPTIQIPERSPLPGDPGITSADDIDDFMIRLKHSLRDEREMLSNTVAFWMVQELADKNWDASAVDIPGLTTGFPPGVTEYPRISSAAGH